MNTPLRSVIQNGGATSLATHRSTAARAQHVLSRSFEAFIFGLDDTLLDSSAIIGRGHATDSITLPRGCSTDEWMAPATDHIEARPEYEKTVCNQLRDIEGGIEL